MNTLTKRQSEILAYIRDQIRFSGFPPTRAEICTHFGFKSPNAAEDHLRALAKKGAIEMMPGASRAIRLVEEPEANDESVLPLIGKVAAGTPILAVENIERQIPVQSDLFRPAANYMLTVEGMSMKDIGILDGDLLAVHKTESARDNEIVVARVDEEVTVKRLEVDSANKQVVLHPENVDFSPIRVNPEQSDFAIEGVVVGVIRNSI